MGSNAMLQFIFLGNLLIEKGPLVLLNACNILHEKGLPFHCHIVGAPTSEINLQELSRRISEKGLSDRVTLHGAQYGANKERILQKADVMVFPTFYHNECFPLVLLEGMKHRLVLISTAEGAIPDIIQNGVNGLIIEKNNTQALANAMQQLIESPETVQKMRQSAQEAYQTQFSDSLFIERLSRILSEA